MSESRALARGESNGGRRRNRTFNLGLKRPLLCQLSYAPVIEPVLLPIGYEQSRAVET